MHQDKYELMSGEQLEVYELMAPPFVCHRAHHLRSGGLDLPKMATKWTNNKDDSIFTDLL